ncbi:TPA: ash family protein [Escherichia coli]|nr:ash family protein [Escherichia coli]HAN3920250.1 ash family protein [Escherichia coli]HAN4109475.1 ash family protein [Escherichia coli]HAN4110880.1 ash family protein [Escherichia coli]HBC1437953.1 ash family protein [Escherichia coli]
MIPVQKKTFSLAGMSPKSSDMTAKSGINTADTSKVYHLLVVGTDALTIPEISGDDISIEKVSGCARKFLVVDDVFRSCSDSTKTFVHVRDVNEMSAMYCASGASNSEFSESIKKSLPLCGNTVYGYKAPHKTGAGIRTPQAIEAIHDAPASFFVSAHTHTLSMVGCMGLTSVRLVSLIASSPNPVQSTASELRTSGGGYKPSIKEAATCWLLPLPKNRNLSGLSQPFAATCRQLPPKFTISPQKLSRKPAAFWRGITFAFLPDVFAQGAHMLNYFRVAGCATARSGELVEFVYIVDARSAISAKAEALNQARNERLSHIQITRIREVAA